MPDLSPLSVPILEGKVVLSKRTGSPYWQSRFRIGRKWIRTSTKTDDLEDARSIATDHYMESKWKEKNSLPIVSRRFRGIASAVKDRLQKQRDDGFAPAVYRDYIQAIDNWLVPFFGNHLIATIDDKLIRAFYEHRASSLKRLPAKTTVNTHASAMRLVYDEAVAQGYMLEANVPALRIKSSAVRNNNNSRRPDFSLDEYRQLYRYMRKWTKQGKNGKHTDMRHLLRDYVLFLSNSGIRHGTEAYGLKWRQIEDVTDENGKSFLRITLTEGKNVKKKGARTAILRPTCRRYLERIKERSEDLRPLSWKKTLKADKHVFRLPNGERTTALDKTFERLLDAAELRTCPLTEKNRTLYSLRHFYITMAIIGNKANPAVIAHQCGTSIAMLEKHYAHLDVWQHREALSR